MLIQRKTHEKHILSSSICVGIKPPQCFFGCTYVREHALYACLYILTCDLSVFGYPHQKTIKTDSLVRSDQCHTSCKSIPTLVLILHFTHCCKGVFHFSGSAVIQQEIRQNDNNNNSDKSCFDAEL